MKGMHGLEIELDLAGYRDRFPIAHRGYEFQLPRGERLREAFSHRIVGRYDLDMPDAAIGLHSEVQHCLTCFESAKTAAMRIGVSSEGHATVTQG